MWNQDPGTAAVLKFCLDSISVLQVWRDPVGQFEYWHFKAQIKITSHQRNNQKWCQTVVRIIPADGLALVVARTSAGTEVTKCWFHIHVLDWYLEAYS